ncbi:MAG: hypothetical protein KBT11_00685 [Treponema sp.]|nr:hypothetical protein [Candidatus Treponema equifaecale]
MTELIFQGQFGHSQKAVASVLENIVHLELNAKGIGVVPKAMFLRRLSLVETRAKTS